MNADDILYFVGEVRDTDDDPVRVLRAAGQVQIEQIDEETRAVIFSELSPESARDLADLIYQAADAAEATVDAPEEDGDS